MKTPGQLLWEHIWKRSVLLSEWNQPNHIGVRETWESAALAAHAAVEEQRREQMKNEIDRLAKDPRALTELQQLLKSIHDSDDWQIGPSAEPATVT